jgi:hypothetical protein
MRKCLQLISDMKEPLYLLVGYDIFPDELYHDNIVDEQHRPGTYPCLLKIFLI